MLTAALLLTAVGGVFWYTIRSVSQNDFSEFENERKLVGDSKQKQATTQKIPEKK